MALITEQTRTKLLSHLENLVGQDVFRTWCRSLDFEELEADSVRVPVPNEFYRDWVERELRAPIEHAFRQVFGHVPPLVFTVRDGGPQTPAVSKEPPSPPRPPEPQPARRLAFAMNAEHTFARFVVGRSNRMAHAAAVSVSEGAGGPASSMNPLFIYGTSGLGKTHLLQAVCHAALQRVPALRILYTTCETFVGDFVTAVQRKQGERFRARYRNWDMLLVDDIHFIANKKGSQEEFFHTFDTLHSAGRQLVLSADAPPKQIPTLEERLSSRFDWGFLARIDPPDFETRLAILRQRAEEAGRKIPDDVLSYIASVEETNIRELEGAVTKILASAALMQRPVDLDLAREALENALYSHDRALAPEDIITTVARHYGKKSSDFRGRRWTKSTSLARHVAVYLTKHLTRLSLAEIGRAFGGKDHSTILYGVRRIEQLRTSDPDFARELDQLARQIYRKP